MNGNGPIPLALAALLATTVATVLPQVRDPWPETIGVDFPFTLAGAVSVGALVVAELTDRPKRVRDRWTRTGLTYGFLAGAAFYLVALLAQLLSVRV